MVSKWYISRNRKRRTVSAVLFIFTLFFSACEAVDDGNEIFMSIRTYQSISDSIPTEYSEVCNCLLNRTNIIHEVLYDTTYTVTKGFNVTMILYKTKSDLPVCVFISKVDLQSSGLTIGACTPDNGSEFKRQKITKQADFVESSGKYVWGGINGDFFNVDNGIPLGIVHKSGKVIKPTFEGSWVNWVAITKDNKAIIGRANEYESNRSKFKDAIGGNAIIIDNGIARRFSDIKMYPRTCIGISQDSTTVYMLAVDGKRTKYSNGMTLNDVTKALYALGSYSAIHLDGGGSTTLIIRDTAKEHHNLFKVVNHPSDDNGERPVANGLLVMNMK